MKRLNAELNTIHTGIVEMANLAESMVQQSIDAISAPNREQLVQSVAGQEAQLDQFQLDLDKNAVRLITLFSPVAHDLRFCISVARITTELERIGDNAVNMCESIQLLAPRTDTIPSSILPEMGALVRKMVGDTVAIVGSSNPIKAKATIELDDQIDQLNHQIVEEHLKASSGSQGEITGALSQILIARCLERIADQCTNVCEEIIYMEDGTDVRHPDLPLDTEVHHSIGHQTHS